MFETAETIGLISFAISGLLMAIHHKLDMLGIVISSFLTALGGGLLRDIMINKTPYIANHNEPILIVLITFAIVFLFRLYKIQDLETKYFFIITDAIGLVAFSITGALVAMQNNFGFFGVLLLAFITAIGGGSLRDMLINKIPSVLTSEIYGVVAIGVAACVFFAAKNNLLSFSTLACIFVVGILIRLIAYHKKWHLPTLS